jgi:hypothetical protein
MLVRKTACGKVVLEMDEDDALLLRHIVGHIGYHKDHDRLHLDHASGFNKAEAREMVARAYFPLAALFNKKEK